MSARLPWMALAAISLIRGNRSRGIVAVAAVGAFCMVGGNPEVVVWGGLGIGALALALRRPADRTWQNLSALAAAALLGIALAGPLLAPFAQISSGSARWSEKAGQSVTWPEAWSTEQLFVASGQRIPLCTLSPRALGRPYRAEFRGASNWVEAVSVGAGSLALPFMVLALADRRRRRQAVVLALLLLACLAIGSSFRPLLWILHKIPLLGVSAHTRALHLVPLALALGLGLGLDALRRARTPALVMAAGLSALIVALDPGWQTGSVFALALIAVFWRQRRELSGVAILLAIALDLAPSARDLLPQGPKQYFFPRTEAIEQIAAELESQGPRRVVGESFSWYPSSSTVHSIEDLRPNDPLAPIDLMEVLGAVFGFFPDQTAYHAAFGNIDHALLDTLNVGVVVSNFAQPAPQSLERMDSEWQHGPHSMWRNPDALPRLYSPSAIERVDSDRTLDWLRRLQDPRKVAVTVAGSWEAGGAEADPVLIDFGSGSFEAILPSSEQKRLIASSIPLLPGWRLEAQDGRRLGIVKVNHAFLGVEVPPGVTSIVAIYRPPWIVAGSLAALFAFACLAWLWRKACSPP